MRSNPAGPRAGCESRSGRGVAQQGSRPTVPSPINALALADGDSRTVSDAGMLTAETTAARQSAFSDVRDGWPVKRTACMHIHLRRLGMAGEQTRRFDCRLWITRVELAYLDRLDHPSGPRRGPRLTLARRAFPWSACVSRAAEHVASAKRARQDVSRRCAKPGTEDLFEIVFRRRVGLDLLTFATGENLAHLSCLLHRG